MHDVVVLGPQDRETIEVVRADQRLDVRDAVRGDARCKLDDDAPLESCRYSVLPGSGRRQSVAPAGTAGPIP
jgi:hypothetical protein